MPDDQVGATHRVPPRRLVATVVAAVMLLGIAGVVGLAVWGFDDEPTGQGLLPPIDAEQPAVPTETAVEREPADGAMPEPPAGAEAPTESGPDGSAAGGDDVAPAADGGAAPASEADGSGGSAAADAAIPIASIEPLAADADLPVPEDGPVELPTLLPAPTAPPAVDPVPLDELDPSTVDSLAGWEVLAIDADYLRLSNGSQLIEVFLVGPAVDATAALTSFFDDLRDDVAGVDQSEIDRLGAPDSRWRSVVGAEFTATRAGQQGTVTITGSAVAGVDVDGNAVVLTSSREGPSSADQRADDGAGLLALLAVVATT